MIDNLLNNMLFSSIALTLLHFLWQGLVVAFILKILLTITSKQNSRTRYAFCSFAMMANLTLPIITFFLIYQPVEQVIKTNPEVINTSILGFSLLENKTELSSYLFPVLPYITFSWLTIISMLAFKLLIEIYKVRSLPNQQSQSAGTELNNRFKELAKIIGLKQTPSLKVSFAVDVPMAIGWLKPVVLLPASMVTGLTPAQLDMLLLHELAHIKRYDYLVNLVQSLVELLLFFHPIVYWVSKQMRVEREYCSDDIAITHCGNPVAYAHTLADTATICQKHRHGIPSMAMAASGGDLKERVLRIVHHHNCTTNVNDSKWLASIVFILGIITISSNELIKLSHLDIDTNNAFFHPVELNNEPSTQNENTAQKIALIPEQKSLTLNKSSLSNTVDSPTTDKTNQQANVQIIEHQQVAISTKLPITEKVLSTTANASSKQLAQEPTKQVTQPSTYVNQTLSSQAKISQAVSTNIAVNKTDNTRLKTATNPSVINATPNIALASIDELNKKVEQETALIKEQHLKSLDNTYAPLESSNTPLNPYQPELAQLVSEPIYDNSFDKFETNSQALQVDNLLTAPQYINVESETINNSPQITPAKAISITDPRYPTSAQRHKIELDLLVNFSIDVNGKVTNIEIEKKNRSYQFRSSILSAMRKWQFKPAQRDGQAIETQMSKIFSFNFNNA